MADNAQVGDGEGDGEGEEVPEMTNDVSISFSSTSSFRLPGWNEHSL